MNLVSLIKDQLGGDTISKLSGALGESSEKTTAGIGAALPTLLAGLAGSASTPEGARQLDQAVSGADSGMLGNLGSLLGGGGGALEKGASMLGPLLGGGSSLGSLSGVLGKFSGLGAGSIMKILGFLGPVVLGFLKKQKTSAGLDASGLASMLAGQKQNIASAMPSGLASILGSTAGLGSVGEMAKGLLGSAGSAVGSTARSATNYAQGAANQAAYAAADAGSSAKKWLLPVAGVAVAALLIWWLASSGSSTVREAGSKAVDATANMTDKVADAAGNAVDATKDAAGNVVDASKDAAGKAVDVTKDAAANTADAMKAGASLGAADHVSGIKDQLTSLFSSTTDSLKGITDPASAAAAIPNLTALSGKLDGIEKLYAQLPDSAKSTVSSMVKSSNGTLQPLLDKAMAIPGVSDKLKPVVEPMLAKLNKLAAM